MQTIKDHTIRLFQTFSNEKYLLANMLWKLRFQSLFLAFKKQFIFYPKGDHERRARQVIQTFRILPITLDISEDMKMSLLHKLNHFKLPQINELTILLKRHNEILTYKSQLYTTKNIILTKRPSSSYDLDRFDYDVYDENGVILSSLHNFKKIERLIKLLQTKFRRLQVIYYIQNVGEKDIDVGDYLCMKKGFKADVLGIFYHDVNNIEDTSKNVQSLNGVQTSKEEFEKFCLQYAINLIENLNQYSRKFQPFIDIVKTKYMFENYVLDFICAGDKKKKENTRRNQIVLRLINLGYSEFLNSKITYEELSVQYLQKIFKKIVEKIMRLENQPQKKVSQSQVIDRHQINPTLSDKVQNLTKAYQKMNQSFLVPSKKYKP